MSEESTKQKEPQGPGPGNAVAPVESNQSKTVAQADQSNLFFRADLANLNEFPNLEEYAVANLELASEYFKGKNLAEGEQVRILFAKFDTQQLPKKSDPSVIEDVPTAFFYAQNKEGDVVFYQNASKKFVNSLADFAAQPGMAFVVTYLGKIEYKNGNEGDNWSIKPILKKVSMNPQKS